MKTNPGCHLDIPRDILKKLRQENDKVKANLCSIVRLC